MALIEYLTIAGVIISLILGVYNLFKLRRNKVNLKIEVSQKEMDSYEVSDYDGKTKHTDVIIEADIVNKGLEPTSISKVTMKLDYKKIKGEMYNSQFGKPNIFEKIRIEPNDRKSEELKIFYPLFLPKNIKEVEATIIFHTTYKDVVKKLKLVKKELI